MNQSNIMIKRLKLSKNMVNVLTAIQEQTIKLKGKNRGDVKKRINFECYDIKTMDALIKRGLINYRHSAIHGNGYAATKRSLLIL